MATIMTPDRVLAQRVELAANAESTRIGNPASYETGWWSRSHVRRQRPHKALHFKGLTSVEFLDATAS